MNADNAKSKPAWISFLGVVLGTSKDMCMGTRESTGRGGGPGRAQELLELCPAASPRAKGRRDMLPSWGRVAGVAAESGQDLRKEKASCAPEAGEAGWVRPFP